ncbi:MAG: glycosyltransferase family 39 protein [Acidobacteria bacterium]|jgi:4-amino-4-deoxy-L-arabinose transferase-like glycosyltransferase|nr:glycosyltransferase family 39 protein [Acidobacteriota bacterium]
MQEITKAKNQRPKSKDQIVWLLFAFVMVAVYFSGLSIALLGPDEPRYAQVAREMFEHNDWITPTLGGANWFEKPALLYWLQIASYNIFGVSEFAARFGSALFGLGTIFSLWILGRQWSVVSSQWSVENPKINDQKSKTDFANWLALIAASSIGLITFSRGASFDIILTFPLTASLVCYFLFEIFLQKHCFSAAPNTILLSKSTLAKIIAVTPPIVWAYLFLFGFYFFIGLALVAKGLIGIVFPFAIVFFYHILKFELLPGRIFLISLLWGTIVSLLVGAVWYLPMFLTHGWSFVDEFFIQHHFQRYTSNKYQHPQPFYFFFWVLPLMTIPWLPFFLASIWDYIKVQSSKFKVQKFDKLSTLDSQLSTFAVAWLLVPLVFFTFSGSKLPGYILPALPAALILTAQYVWRFVRKSKTRAYVLQIVAFATFAATVLILQFYVISYAPQETVKNLIAIADVGGYADARVLNLHTISHNAEFYAAGRLTRNTDGKLKKYFGVAEVAEEIRRGGNRDVLVLVPLEYLHELPESDLVESKILGNNGELAIVAVKNR